jgi:hypothetical protein
LAFSGLLPAFADEVLPAFSAGVLVGFFFLAAMMLSPLMMGWEPGIAPAALPY